MSKFLTICNLTALMPKQFVMFGRDWLPFLFGILFLQRFAIDYFGHRKFLISNIYTSNYVFATGFGKYIHGVCVCVDVRAQQCFSLLDRHTHTHTSKYLSVCVWCLPFPLLCMFLEFLNFMHEPAICECVCLSVWLFGNTKTSTNFAPNNLRVLEQALKQVESEYGSCNKQQQ